MQLHLYFGEYISIVAIKSLCWWLITYIFWWYIPKNWNTMVRMQLHLYFSDCSSKNMITSTFLRYIFVLMITSLCWWLHFHVGDYITILVLTSPFWWLHIHFGDFIFILVITFPLWCLNLNFGDYISMLVISSLF